MSIIITKQELAFQNEEKEKRAAELITANIELAFQNVEKEKRAAELITANIELAFQNEEKEKRAAELITANIELAFQNEEKEKRAEELTLANQKIGFQIEEKEKRAQELNLANKKIDFQIEEREKRAAELITANIELAFQHLEKEKRATELVVANKELVFQNKEKEKRAAELVLANKELVFQNEEKEKRAAELHIANKELVFQNEEKEKRAAELHIANKELVFQNEEKEKRAAELHIANKELVFQNEEKEKRAAELHIANKELLFQNDEKGKRAIELSETLERVSFLATIADNIQDPVISSDNNGNITRWNKAAEKLLEWKSEEVIGKNAAELLKVDYPDTSREQISETLKTNALWQGELIYCTKSDKRLNVLVTVSLLKDAKGNVSGNLILVRDITELKDTERELSKLNAELEQKVEERTSEIIKNENRFRGLIENNNDIIRLSDKDLNPIYRSPNLERITGWKNEDIEKAGDAFLVHPEDREKMASFLKETKSNPEKIIPFTYRFKHKNGHYIWVEGTAINMLHDESIKGIITNFRDVTERKKAEETIAKTLKEKKMILESIGDAFFAVDKNWIVTYWNRIAEIALGVNKKDVIDKHLWKIFSDSIDSLSYIKYHEALSTNHVVHFEDYYPTLQKWYEIDAYPSENGLSVFFKDISERKKAQEEIIILNEELEKRVIERTEKLMIANKELEQFAYVASHDLQEPLRTVSNYMEVFEEDYSEQLDENAIKYIHAVNSATKRMSGLIKSLLDFSRLGHNTKLVYVDCKNLIAEVLSDLDIMIKNSKAIIDVSEMPELNVYETELRQVFQNLITNAIKFRKKDIQPKIKIASKKKNDVWTFSVSDNGIGIDPIYYRQIFEIFQRLETKEKYEGSGIGLANCKKIIQLHHGEIWIESNPEQGSTFYFTIPNLIL